MYQLDTMRICLLSASLIFVSSGQLNALADEGDQPQAAPISAAVIRFQDRTEGAKGGVEKGTIADKVAELLSIELLNAPEFMLVERAELDQILKEHELNLSGLVAATDAVRVGQLTGAKLLITGSVIDTGTDRYLVAKIISTETSRVLGASAKGKVTDNLGEMITKLAEQLATTVRERGTTILATDVSQEDRLEKLRKLLKGKPLPSVMVRIGEQHIGVPAADPAAETELTHWCRELGWTTIDPANGNESDAEYLVIGEGMSELSGRRGNLVSVRARLEVRIVNRRSGEIIAVDSQTTRAVDATELIAGKSALQQAAASIAERLLPQVVMPEKRTGRKKQELKSR